MTSSFDKPLTRSESTSSIQDKESHRRSSIYKLQLINNIIDRAHDYGHSTRKPSEMEEQVQNHLRTRMKATQSRVNGALNDGLHDTTSSHVAIDQQRYVLQSSKSTKRMEQYVQQKRREVSTSIGAVLKRTSFLDHAMVDEKNSNTTMSVEAKVDKSKVFGIYGVKEVMSVIRLFTSMDHDGSGQLTLSELKSCALFFEKMGFYDMNTVFQAMDRDGNGTVTLKELLQSCFHYATKTQIGEMLTLAKMGTIRSYVQAKTSPHHITPVPDQAIEENHTTARNNGPSAEERAELLAIFQVFDKNGDGTISMDELMEALRVDDDDVIARVMIEEEQKATRLGRRRSSSDAMTHSDLTSGLTKEYITQLYTSFDTDGNKALDFEEFVLLMHTLHHGIKPTGL